MSGSNGQNMEKKMLFSSLPGDVVVVLVWVALQERVMSEAWISRCGSSLRQGTPHLWFLDHFFQLCSSPVFTMRYTSHMGFFCQAKFSDVNEVPGHSDDRGS